MRIEEIKLNKKRYLPLLLLADEQEDMVERYLDKGIMYVLIDNGVKSECIITDEGNGILEIKNIATVPNYQGRGYGKALIDFVAKKYKKRYSVLQVGTGDSPLTIPFYEKCGFSRSHNIKNFFVDNYDHPIYEYGIQLIDMVYLQRKIWFSHLSKWYIGSKCRFGLDIPADTVDQGSRCSRSTNLLVYLMQNMNCFTKIKNIVYKTEFLKEKQPGWKNE